MAILRSTTRLYLNGFFALLILAGTGCAQKVEDDRARTLTRKEVEKLPSIDQPTNNTPSNPNIETGESSFSISQLEQYAPLELVSLETSHGKNQRSAGLALNDPEESRASTSAPASGNSADFRAWYSVASEPEKSKHFSVRCSKNLEPNSDNRPRIVMVRLKDVTQTTPSTLETVAFRIARCDQVSYGILGLQDSKLYVLEARVYDYFKDAVDSASSLFSTRLVLEGSALNIKKNSNSQIDYKRAVDSSTASVDATVGEGGASENDALVGGAVRITVNRTEDSDAVKPVANIDITLRHESRGLRPVTLKTDANGVATTSKLPIGYWVVDVKGMAVGGMVYNALTSRVQINTNQDLSHTVVMKPQVYGWLFETTVPVQIGTLMGSFRVSAGINERPDGNGSHQGFALPAFLKYCATSLATTETSLEGQIKNLVANKLKEISARPTAAARDEETKKFKFTTANQSSKIESIEPDYLKTVGKQIAWDPIPTLAPFGASKPCTIK